jgi:hypothetical protein
LKSLTTTLAPLEANRIAYLVMLNDVQYLLTPEIRRNLLTFVPILHLHQ